MRDDATIIGRCCGTTPGRIRHVVEKVTPLKPRATQEHPVGLRISGLPFELAL